MNKKIDFAPYYLEADKKMKEAYELLKVSKYEEAAVLIDEATIELRMMRVAVKSHVE
jgi:non-homologous end joining protein Ku